MLTTALILSLAAGPKAPPGAEMITFVPKVDGVTQLLPFFQAAGTRSLILKPETWAADAHPLINVNLLDKEALARSGIDGNAGLSRSQLGDVVIGCVTVKDLEAYRAACDPKLARMGEVFQKTENGVTLHGSRDPLGRVLVAYAIAGKESCAIAGHGRSIDSQLPALMKLVNKPTTNPAITMAAKMPGAIQFIISGSRHAVVSLNGKDLTVTADAKMKAHRMNEFAGAGESPLGKFAPAGMTVVRARFKKADMPHVVEQLVRNFPGSTALLPVAKTIAPHLTGNTAAVASHAKVTTGLRTKEARFFALKMAIVAEVDDVAAVQASLDTLDAKTLATREGTISVSLNGKFLIVSNDGEAKAKAENALANAAGKQAHGLEFVVDPRLVARGLQQVPLLEAVQSQELAGLVAAGSELGPLLLASKQLFGWVDSAGEQLHTAKLTWELDAAAFQTTDAGVK
ncbi:MAG: hypothetical protein ACO1OB_27890 [Archangium sp.]